jgi:hypothetical protein
MAVRGEGTAHRNKFAKDQTPSQLAASPKSRKLLAKAFSQPEGSSERLQVFSEYLNALHDEHAK